MGWFLRLFLPWSCLCICCFVGGCTCSCSGTGCGWFLSLFGVVFAAVSAVVVLVYLLLHGRLHVLVLGLRLQVFLCLCLRWFLRLFLPCSCSLIRCFMSGCTRSCSGTSRLCSFAVLRSDFAAGAFVRVLLFRMVLALLQALSHGVFVVFLEQRCSCSRIRCFWPCSTRRRPDEPQKCGSYCVYLLSRNCS